MQLELYLSVDVLPALSECQGVILSTYPIIRTTVVVTVVTPHR